MDEYGCINFADQNLKVNDILHPYAGPDSLLCAEQQITLNATTVGAVSYEWYPGGQTTADISVDSTGIGLGSQLFIVYVTDGNNCISSDSVTIGFKDCTGISELAGVNNVKLYPNPGQGVFTLQIDSDDPLQVNLKVYNNKGGLVLEQQNVRFESSSLVRMDLTDQPAGIYLIAISNNEGQWVGKLIIRN